MTIREQPPVVGTGEPQSTFDYQRQADFMPVARGSQRRDKTPHKWQRVLSALLTGRSFNRFEAERELADHCLHSTVSTLESKGVRISRKTESVPGFQGIPTEVTRYWLDLSDVANVQKAFELLGEVPAQSERWKKALAEEARQRAERAQLRGQR